MNLLHLVLRAKLRLYRGQFPVLHSAFRVTVSIELVHVVDGEDILFVYFRPLRGHGLAPDPRPPPLVLPPQVDDDRERYHRQQDLDRVDLALCQVVMHGGVTVANS